MFRSNSLREFAKQFGGSNSLIFMTSISLFQEPTCTTLPGYQFIYLTKTNVCLYCCYCCYCYCCCMLYVVVSSSRIFTTHTPMSGSRSSLPVRQPLATARVGFDGV